jgi:hypothetical protein
MQIIDKEVDVMTEKVVLDLSAVELASLQIEQYHQNGYLVLESIIPESVCARFSALYFYH